MILLRVLLLVLAMTAPALAAGTAAPSLQELYDRGTAAAAAGRDAEAANLFYQGLEKLRAAGEGDTPDAGMFAAGVARALAASGDDQADAAYRLAVHLLMRSADPVPLVSVARQFVSRLLQAEQADEAIAVSEALLARMAHDRMDDAVRAAIIETAFGAYGAARRDADADRVLTQAVTLVGKDPDVAYLRALARMQIARDAEKAGRMAETAAALDAGLADLKLAGERGRDLLGPLLLMRGTMLFNDGDYRNALPPIEEAASVLEADPSEEDDWFKAVALRNRLLERVDRVREALAGAEDAIAAFAARKGADSAIAVSARLDRIEILVRAGRIPEARAALADENDRLGGEADPLIAGYYFERLAAVDMADGDYREAVEAAERAIAIRRESYPDLEALLVSPMRLRASASDGITDLGFAEQAHRELIALSERVFPPNHPEVARDLNDFAAFLATFRRYGEAEAIERRVVGILKIAYGADAAKYAFALHNLATFIMFTGNAEEAEGLIEEAVAIAGKLPDQDDFLAMARVNLASAQLTLGRFADALATAQLAEALHKGLPAKTQKRLSSVHGLAMQALAGLGRPQEAIAAGRLMVAALSQETYEDAANRALGLTRFAGVLVKSGPATEALAAARAALSATESLSLQSGGDYREAAAILAGAAWRAAR